MPPDVSWMRVDAPPVLRAISWVPGVDGATVRAANTTCPAPFTPYAGRLPPSVSIDELAPLMASPSKWIVERVGVVGSYV